MKNSMPKKHISTGSSFACILFFHLYPMSETSEITSKQTFGAENNQE